jgi:hypothetical protein
VAVFVAMLVAGCASTSIKSAWFDPGYTGGPFRKILVVGVHGSLADSRVFEDIFTQKLGATGVEGVPGYRIVGSDGAGDEPAWTAAVARSGADGLLTVRLLRVDTQTRITTTMMSGPMLWGPYGGWWGPGMMPVQEVTQYDIASVETTLWDVKSRRVVWAATTDTFNPTTVAKETPGFADLIIEQLVARGLAPAKK